MKLRTLRNDPETLRAVVGTIEIESVEAFKKEYDAYKLEEAIREPGECKKPHNPRHPILTTVKKGQLTIYLPGTSSHKYIVLEEGESMLFLDFEKKPKDCYSGHGSIAGFTGATLAPHQLRIEPNLDALGWTLSE